MMRDFVMPGAMHLRQEPEVKLLIHLSNNLCLDKSEDILILGAVQPILASSLLTDNLNSEA